MLKKRKPLLKRINDVKAEKSRCENLIFDIKKRISYLNKSVSLKEKQVKKHEKCMLLLQLLIENKHEEVVGLVEDTVTSALQDLFGNDYRFKLDFGKRGNFQSCDFLIGTGEYEGFVPIKMCHGNGLKSVVSTITRLIIISILKGSKIIFLDESFDGLKTQKDNVAGKLLRSVSEEFGLQVNLVTHREGIKYASNKVVEL